MDAYIVSPLQCSTDLEAKVFIPSNIQTQNESCFLAADMWGCQGINKNFSVLGGGVGGFHTFISKINTKLVC